MLSEPLYSVLLTKCACTFHPVATVAGDLPLAVKVPSALVTTSGRLSAPVPSKAIVAPPMPAPDAALSVSLPVTVTGLPHGAFVIVFNVRVVT